MLDKALKEELQVSYTILEDMNEWIQAREIFPHELKDLGELSIKKLGSHKIEDYECRRFVDDTIDLLKLQLEINEENIKSRDKVWKQSQSKRSPMTNHD